MKKKFKYRIGITTGDSDGIGPEVTFKALKSLSSESQTQFFIYCSKKRSAYEALLPLRREMERIDFLSNEKFNIVRSSKGPSFWVEEVADLAKKKKLDALVTAPLSKPQILKDGFRDMGHTGILKRVCNAKSVFMTFLGPEMNVTLLSGHIPIADVQASLNKKIFELALNEVLKIKALLKIKGQVGVLGLNPHAGDSGVISKFDFKIQGWVHNLNRKGVHSKILVPDAAFTKSMRSKIGFYLAMYHDQGLVPFKTLHGVENGVHISLGLPIVRTSVDHGTAKDIFNKNLANSTSMKQAIESAIVLVDRRSLNHV